MELIRPLIETAVLFILFFAVALVCIKVMDFLLKRVRPKEENALQTAAIRLVTTVTIVGFMALLIWLYSIKLTFGV
jgi:heme/copper-type cytochrome/quinol oxidase subunit 4